MENEELISKKDLLEVADISYGQLYRWKRKGLIPEEWFIRKSTFTGQETFFPRSRVLSRIGRIKSMKEDVSLDELADVFSPSPGELSASPEVLTKRNIVASDVIKLYQEYSGVAERLGPQELTAVFLLNRFLSGGDIGIEEGRQLLDVLREGSLKYGDLPGEVILARKMGIFCCFYVSPPSGVVFDKGVRVIGRANTAASIEELKIKLLREEF